MKTKQSVCLALALVLLMSLFSACGGQREETSQSFPSADSTTEVPTEPLPTEILSREQDGFYIGDAVRTYDRQGNLIKEEYDFHYQDGSTSVGYTCYDTNGNEIERHYNCYDINGNNTEGFFAEHSANGTRKSFYLAKYDEAGTCIYREMESYYGYGNRLPWEKELLIYDPEQGVWNHTRGVYWEDGTISTGWEKTLDAHHNLIKSVEYDYDFNGVCESTLVEDYKYDDNGNLTWYGTAFYGPDGSIIESQEIFCQMYGSENRVIKECFTDDFTSETVEYTYNAQGTITDLHGLSDLFGEWTMKIEFNDRGLLIKEHTLSNDGFEKTWEYEYNSQDLLIKSHSIEAQSDGYFLEYTTEYEYNDLGSPIAVYTLISAYIADTPIRSDEEQRYNYIYDETGRCIMVEYVFITHGQEFSREQFQCDDNGYIYDGGKQLYPLLPPDPYPTLPPTTYLENPFE